MHIIHNHYNYEHRHDDRKHNDTDDCNRPNFYIVHDSTAPNDTSVYRSDSDSGDVDDADTGPADDFGYPDEPSFDNDDWNNPDDDDPALD